MLEYSQVVNEKKKSVDERQACRLPQCGDKQQELNSRSTRRILPSSYITL